MSSHRKHALGKYTLGLAALFAVSLSGPFIGTALADSAGATPARTNTVSQTTGEDIYAHVCQACHMPEGEGAVGAGKYPPLAKNENLESAGYPIYLILHGQKGMPPVGEMMSDEQVAAVVNYVRSHFGNDYKDEATAEDVKDAR